MEQLPAHHINKQTNKHQAFDMHLNFLVLALQFNSDIKLFKFSGLSFRV